MEVMKAGTTIAIVTENSSKTTSTKDVFYQYEKPRNRLFVTHKREFPFNVEYLYVKGDDNMNSENWFKEFVQGKADDNTFKSKGHVIPEEKAKRGAINEALKLEKDGLVMYMQKGLYTIPGLQECVMFSGIFTKKGLEKIKNQYSK